MALVEASPKVITHRAARALHACSARRISSINLLFDIKHVLLGHLSAGYRIVVPREISAKRHSFRFVYLFFDDGGATIES